LYHLHFEERNKNVRAPGFGLCSFQEVSTGDFPQGSLFTSELYC